MIKRFKDHLQDFVFPADELHGLSYYEILEKIKWKLNECIKEFNELEKKENQFEIDMTNKYNELLAVWKELQEWISDWFNNIDVSEEFYKLWQKVVESGEALEVMKPFITENLTNYWNEFLQNYNIFKDALTKEWTEYQNNLNSEWKEFKEKFEDTDAQFRTEILNKISEFETTITNLQTQWENYQEIINNQITELTTNVNNLKTMVSGFETRLNEDEKTIAANTESIGNINTSIEDIRNDIEKINTEINSIKEQITNLNTDITNLQTNINQNTNAITEINKILENFQNDITNIMDLIGGLTSLEGVKIYKTVEDMKADENIKAGDKLLVLRCNNNQTQGFTAITEQTYSIYESLKNELYAEYFDNELHLVFNKQLNYYFDSLANGYPIFNVFLDAYLESDSTQFYTLPRNNMSFEAIRYYNLLSFGINFNRSYLYFKNCEISCRGNTTASKFVQCSLFCGEITYTNCTFIDCEINSNSPSNLYFNYCNFIDCKIIENGAQYNNCNFSNTNITISNYFKFLNSNISDCEFTINENINSFGSNCQFTNTNISFIETPTNRLKISTHKFINCIIGNSEAEIINCKLINCEISGKRINITNSYIVNCTILSNAYLFNTFSLNTEFSSTDMVFNTVTGDINITMERAKIILTDCINITVITQNNTFEGSGNIIILKSKNDDFSGLNNSIIIQNTGTAQPNKIIDIN